MCGLGYAKRDSARVGFALSMTDRWRLINGAELYDIDADPAQSRDVAGAHPERVAELRAAYEAWWLDVTKDADEYCRTVIGSAHQSKVVMTSQQWHGEKVLYSQNHVRAGIEANGFWDLEVAVAGRYDITLRRWESIPDVDLAHWPASSLVVLGSPFGWGPFGVSPSGLGSSAGLLASFFCGRTRSS